MHACRYGSLYSSRRTAWNVTHVPNPCCAECCVHHGHDLALYGRHGTLNRDAAAKTLTNLSLEALTLFATYGNISITGSRKFDRERPSAMYRCRTVRFSRPAPIIRCLFVR